MLALKRKIQVLALTCGVGLTFQLGGCLDYYTYAGVQGINFCSIFNCEGSTFFDICGTNPLLADCPNVIDDGTGDDTTDDVIDTPTTNDTTDVTTFTF